MDIKRLVQIVDNNARVTDSFINEFKGQLWKHTLDISDINKILEKVLKSQSRLNSKMRIYTLVFGTFTVMAVGRLNKHEMEIERLRCEIEGLKHRKGI